MQLQHSAAAMAAGDQNWPSIPTTMKDEIKTYMWQSQIEFRYYADLVSLNYFDKKTV